MNQQNFVRKMMYEDPKIDVVQISCADIITTSGNSDDNQGEWDPQTVVL